MQPRSRGVRHAEERPGLCEPEIGNVIALSARALVGRSCPVGRLFEWTLRGPVEVGVSGDRMIRPRDPSIRTRAGRATTMLIESVGRPAGFRAATIPGRVRGRCVVVLEVVAPAEAIDAHVGDLSWLAIVAAKAIDDEGLARSVLPLEPEPVGAGRLADLTPRERQVLGLLSEGWTNERIAERLGISRNTVRTHVQNIRAKLDVGTRLEAAALLLRSGADSGASDALGA
jgi:DNA-binding CsgD family transcriptional regulator